jgi:5'-AMP-activated protein kinase, catalytic alpha subunit
VGAVFGRLKELAERLKLKIQKKESGVLKLAAQKEGMKGFLELDAEVFELAPSFLLVELKKASGDTIEYQRLVREEVRPALKDMVWAWQSDRHQQQQQRCEQSVQGEDQQQPLSSLPTQQ